MVSVKKLNTVGTLGLVCSLWITPSPKRETQSDFYFTYFVQKSNKLDDLTS
jgi:hypothetical protein